MKMQQIVVHPRETLERRLDVTQSKIRDHESKHERSEGFMGWSSNGFMGWSSNGFMGWSSNGFMGWSSNGFMGW
jgi:hypothetical protein